MAAGTSKSQISEHHQSLPKHSLVLKHLTYFCSLLIQLVPNIPRIPVFFVYSQKVVVTPLMLFTKSRRSSMSFAYPLNLRNYDFHTNLEICLSPISIIQEPQKSG